MTLYIRASKSKYNFHPGESQYQNELRPACCSGRFVDGSIIYCFVLTRHGVDGVEGDGLEVDGLADGVGDALVADDVAEAPDLLNSLASSMLSTQLLRGSIV